MQELALTYYSKALRGLSEVLVNVNQLENHNSILMSMMLLYLHGVSVASLEQLLALLTRRSVWEGVLIMIFLGT